MLHNDYFIFAAHAATLKFAEKFKDSPAVRRPTTTARYGASTLIGAREDSSATAVWKT